MKNIPGIYKILNKLNNRVYYGSTNKLKKRKDTHFSELRNNKHNNNFLQNDYNKCGFETFVFEVVLETNCLDLLLDFEQEYLDEFWDNQINCYNFSKCAGAPMRGIKGHKLSAEHKKKISDKNKGQRRTEDTCKKMSESQKGKLEENNLKVMLAPTIIFLIKNIL